MPAVLNSVLQGPCWKSLWKLIVTLVQPSLQPRLINPCPEICRPIFRQPCPWNLIPAKLSPLTAQLTHPEKEIPRFQWSLTTRCHQIRSPGSRSTNTLARCADVSHLI